jgi:hypothetical protein
MTAVGVFNLNDTVSSDNFVIIANTEGAGSVAIYNTLAGGYAEILPDSIRYNKNSQNYYYRFPLKSGTLALTTDTLRSYDNLDSVVQRGATTNTRMIATGGVQTVDSVVVKGGTKNVSILTRENIFSDNWYGKIAATSD